MTWTNYTNTGPFTNNVTPPGISATFLNNVESFLDQIIAPAAADSHITADGNGNVTVLSITMTHGKITRVAFGFSAITTGGTTVTHNLGAIPSVVLMTPSAAAITFYINSTMTSTTFQAFVSTNNNVWWLAIA